MDQRGLIPISAVLLLLVIVAGPLAAFPEHAIHHSMSHHGTVEASHGHAGYSYNPPNMPEEPEQPAGYSYPPPSVPFNPLAPGHMEDTGHGHMEEAGHGHMEEAGHHMEEADHGHMGEAGHDHMEEAGHGHMEENGHGHMEEGHGHSGYNLEPPHTTEPPHEEEHAGYNYEPPHKEKHAGYNYEPPHEEEHAGYNYEPPTNSYIPPEMNEWADETYDKVWAVKDDNVGLDFGQDEMAKNNVVDGSYHVLLPDGRIQTVTYHVDKDSGYTASVSYKQGPMPALHHSYDAPAEPAPLYETPSSPPPPSLYETPSSPPPPSLYETPSSSPPPSLYETPASHETSQESHHEPVLDLRTG